jgi:RNA polymerase sigma-70 factor (ECF subfamily)
MDGQEVTQLLGALRDGDRSALDRLMALVYDELRQIAHRHLRGERADHTLSTTALVHEAYLQLIDQKQTQWNDRAHFFAVASMAVRRILIDYARRRGAQKRGGGAQMVSLDDAVLVPAEQAEALLALDEALTRLETLDPRMSRVVECRFFGGLTVDETAEVLAVSPSTIDRDWGKAKLWLYREMRRSLAA